MHAHHAQTDNGIERAAEQAAARPNPPQMQGTAVNTLVGMLPATVDAQEARRLVAQHTRELAEDVRSIRGPLRHADTIRYVAAVLEEHAAAVEGRPMLPSRDLLAPVPGLHP